MEIKLNNCNAFFDEMRVELREFSLNAENKFIFMAIEYNDNIEKIKKVNMERKIKIKIVSQNQKTSILLDAKILLLIEEKTNDWGHKIMFSIYYK